MMWVKSVIYLEGEPCQLELDLCWQTRRWTERLKLQAGGERETHFEVERLNHLFFLFALHIFLLNSAISSVVITNHLVINDGVNCAGLN